MKINAQVIEKLNPCTERFESFKKQYPNFDGTLSDFVALENISYSDKVWVAVRLLSKNQLVHWSIACAESVKHIFESRYPENKSVTNLLDYMKSISDFENLTRVQLDKLKELRVVVRNDAADAATSAAYAAAYAAATSAAYAAAEEQRNLNLLLLASLEQD